jgi:diacylglycerol kinase (ATP)
MAAERATIIFNPISGRAGRRAADAREMKRLLSLHDIDADLTATKGPGDATRLAREAVSSGRELVVCHGGDGTINEVIQAMALGSATLAVWAGGTSNVIARELGLPFDATRLAEVIVARKTIRASLGVASSETAGDPKRRYFLMMAGIGLDASVARGVNQRLKRRAGELAYWFSGIRHLLSWTPERFKILAGDSSFESTFTVIGKGKGYGGEMVMTPGAKLTDPEFEVFILPPLASNFAYLRVLIACLRGRPEQTEATIIKAKTLRANSTNTPWVELDGEVVGPLPMTFEVVPDALSLIVP